MDKGRLLLHQQLQKTEPTHDGSIIETDLGWRRRRPMLLPLMLPLLLPVLLPLLPPLLLLPMLLPLLLLQLLQLLTLPLLLPLLLLLRLPMIHTIIRIGFHKNAAQDARLDDALSLSHRRSLGRSSKRVPSLGYSAS